MNRRMLTGFVMVLLAPTFLAAATPNDAKSLQQTLDRAPRWDEKPFAPADGSTVHTNPPAFVWLPLLKRPAKYVLAVSRSAEFTPAETTVVEDVPLSVHIPTATLKPGVWYWRVGVHAADRALVWSQSRKFTLAADAMAWPFPPIEQVVARIPRGHPRLFFPGQTLERVRRDWPQQYPKDYEQLLRNAQRAIGQPLYPEPGRLEKKGVERAADYAAIIRSSRPPMDAMETCALAYVVSGERKYGDEAKRLLLHFFSWDPEGSTSLFHNDEPAMWVMQRGCRAYDWTYDLFTAEERAKIEPAMKARARQFLKRLTGMPFESNPYSSHPARDVGFLGEASMLFIHEWPEAKDWLEYVMKIYWSVYPAWASEDGGWHEGPTYWAGYQSFALHFITALKMAADVDIARKPFFHNTPYFKLYTNPPYGRLSPFGDGAEISPTGAATLMYAFAQLLHDPYLRWYPEITRSGSGTAPLGVALADPTLVAKPPVDLPQSRVFPGAGLVAMHDDLCDPARSAYLVLRSSPLGSVSHGHADQNAFAIEAYGEALAIASGYYPFYGSHHHDEWTRETKAVNSITIDGGQGQTKRSADAHGRIDSFVAGVNIDYARADATAAYSGRLKKFVRHVIHFRPGTFVIIDELEAPKPVTFEWNLHALEKMDINESSGEVLIHRGKARLRASFLVPKSLTFRQTDQFDPPPEKQARSTANQWHMVAATREKCEKAVFFVVLQTYPVKEKTEPALPKFKSNEDHGVIAVIGRDGSRDRTIQFAADATQPRIVAQSVAGLTETINLDQAQPTLTTTGSRTSSMRGSAVAGTDPVAPLAVSCNGQCIDLRGRYCRPGPVWEQTFAGPDGRYRVKLPEGLHLLAGVQPVHDGETVALRHGQTLWWYGEIPSTPAELNRLSETKKK